MRNLANPVKDGNLNKSSLKIEFTTSLVFRPHQASFINRQLQEESISQYFVRPSEPFQFPDDGSTEQFTLSALQYGLK